MRLQPFVDVGVDFLAILVHEEAMIGIWVDVNRLIWGGDKPE